MKLCYGRIYESYSVRSFIEKSRVRRDFVSGFKRNFSNLSTKYRASVYGRYTIPGARTNTRSVGKKRRRTVASCKIPASLTSRRLKSMLAVRSTGLFPPVKLPAFRLTRFQFVFLSNTIYPREDLI